MENSILDKIIESKHIEDAHQFNPGELVNDLLRNLKDLEKEVVFKRYGLNGQKNYTLEQIGKEHEITRERVRQIQNAAIKKIKALNDLNSRLETVSHTVNHLLKNFGGIMEEAHFLENLLSYSEDSPKNRQATLFIISELMADQLEKIKANEYIMSGWKLKHVSLDNVIEALKILENIIIENNKLLQQQEIIDNFKNHQYFKNNQEQFLPVGASTEEINDDKINQIIHSYLKISQKINPNILDQWGLTDWQTISPKRMGDKIYLVLQKQEKPLHFTEITNFINEAKFDSKIAYPATIHNELILDDRYVLVGRGIYALKEWGYNPGTVSEVIEKILKNSDHQLTKDEILDKVLKERFVKKSTIYLALTNKNKFTKTADGYILNTVENK